jgi:hypothetical protein
VVPSSIPALLFLRLPSDAGWELSGHVQAPVGEVEAAPEAVADAAVEAD